MFKSITGDLKQKYFYKNLKIEIKQQKHALWHAQIFPLYFGIPAVIGRYNFLLQFWYIKNLKKSLKITIVIKFSGL